MPEEGKGTHTDPDGCPQAGGVPTPPMVAPPPRLLRLRTSHPPPGGTAGGPTGRSQASRAGRTGNGQAPALCRAKSIPQPAWGGSAGSLGVCLGRRWLSWPRTSGSRGSCGPCRPWPERPSVRPGCWRSPRGWRSGGPRGRPAAGAPSCACAQPRQPCARAQAAPAARSPGCT